ncbi:hypothetical protein BsWGS_20964 [Bradybaena similaris]
MADFNESNKVYEDEDDTYNEDESISERLVGLTEMFPEGVCKTCCQAGNIVGTVSKSAFWFLRNALWIASSTAVILILPVVFESERAQQHEAQLQQQRQILLGPNAAVSGPPGGGNLLPGMVMSQSHRQ